MNLTELQDGMAGRLLTFNKSLRFFRIERRAHRALNQRREALSDSHGQIKSLLDPQLYKIHPQQNTTCSVKT